MLGRIPPWIKAHPLLAYFALAYAISWIIVLPLVAYAQGFIEVPVPFALHYLNDYGPLLAAIIVARIADGPEGMRELFRGMIRWRAGLAWVLVAAFSPLVLFGIAAGIAVFAIGEAPPELGLLGELPYLPYLGLGGWIFWLLTVGLGEESGWRGYALPKLQADMSALSATLIVAFFWVLWHLPRFFYFDGFLDQGFSALPLFALQLLLLAILLTWLYNSGRGSILAAALFHSGFNFFLSSPADVGEMTIIIRGLLIVWVIAVIVAFKPTNLSARGKHMM
jgi:CAAX protease family protein